MVEVITLTLDLRLISHFYAYCTSTAIFVSGFIRLKVITLRYD